MTNERFEEFLKKAAREYHEPPETPRDSIWARIEATRGDRGNRSAESRFSVWFRVGAGIAAVLAVGIGIGRLTVGGTGVDVRTPLVALEEEAEDDGLAFHMAALEYLGRTDAFLALFRSEARAGTADEEVTEWARDLLTTARLMMDSPAADDGTLKTLLEDLELILAQIAQYSADVGVEELELIEQGMEVRGVMLRLQAVTAEPTAIATEGTYQ